MPTGCQKVHEVAFKSLQYDSEGLWDASEASKVAGWACEAAVWVYERESGTCQVWVRPMR